MNLKEFLDIKSEEYNNTSFIENDPIQIPHKFKTKEDIEISGFLTATIAWGNRKSIINSSKRMMELLENDPYNFIINHSDKDLKSLLGFVHRTFNGYDFIQFVKSLKNIYCNHGGLEMVFFNNMKDNSLHNSIHQLKNIFFEKEHLKRTRKHVSDPFKGSAAKRINMFLRWMVRPNDSGVDFGIWDSISTSQLSCPLDVHSGKVARKLGLLQREQNDNKALKELDRNLRKFDKNDPAKYDFALFGLGVFEKF